MNETIEKSAKALAMQAVAARCVGSSTAEYSLEQFSEDVRLLAEKIVELVQASGQPPPTAAKKLARKPRTAASSAPTGAASVTPGDISRALAGGEKLSLQGLAAKLETTTGKVGRALAALGSAVKSERGINPPGKRGKAPVVYFLA